MDDSFVEDTESFIAQLRLPSDAGTNPPELQIGLNTTTVSILDNDCKQIGRVKIGRVKIGRVKVGRVKIGRAKI